MEFHVTSSRMSRNIIHSEWDDIWSSTGHHSQRIGLVIQRIGDYVSIIGSAQINHV